ncbi:MAG: glucose-6-phosphate dehydrogenase assembly protein OpcA [Actinomycetota bacterium]|nr:glucose-6-phosphate dehydrogenase assembly protein OpcA [Actinomycetota bacterium]
MPEPARLQKWAGRGVKIADLEHELTILRYASTEHDGVSDLRTSVMTHVAWVPEDWLPAATAALAGLADRHPSRTILLIPDPGAERDELDAEVSVQCFPLPGQERHVCSEVIDLWLRGRRTEAPASIVQPLLLADLPAFSRWRGQPPFDAREFKQIVSVVDRLVVDSSEWPEVPRAYVPYAELFDQVVVSDIAWTRSLPWREAAAHLWPEIADADDVWVTGPRTEAYLLTGWLRSRLGREFRLDLTEEVFGEANEVVVGGKIAPIRRDPPRSSSDLLSEELDVYVRDPAYEAAVRAAAQM